MGTRTAGRCLSGPTKSTWTAQKSAETRRDHRTKPKRNSTCRRTAKDGFSRASSAEREAGWSPPRAVPMAPGVRAPAIR